MNTQLSPALVADSEDPGWGEVVLQGQVLPLVNSIQDYTECDRLEAIRRAAFYAERLWDAGIILVPAATHLRSRLGVLLAVLALGMLLGNLDPIRLDLPYMVD